MKKLVTPIALVVLLCLAFGCQDKEAVAELEKFKAQAEIEEQNKAIVLRWFEELSKSNFEALYEELFAPDRKQYMPPNAEPMSFEDYKLMAIGLYNAFPEIEHNVEDIVAEGDKVVAKILVHTVHQGEFAGIPATGKELEWTVIAIFQISDGKIKTRWEIADILGLYEQLGMELKPKEGEK
ncbi:MAG: ester cyclase [Candidatus Aminicenantales bacterium]